MQYFINAGSMPLGLNFIEILIHMLNFAILIVVVRFLLYKPIKKFIDNRAKQYIDKEEHSEAVKKEAEELYSNYQNLLANARRDATCSAEEITSAARLEADEIINHAKVKSNQMIEKSHNDIKMYENESKENLSKAVVELAVNMAAKILEREVNESDNEIIITNIIEEWKKD